MSSQSPTLFSVRTSSGMLFGNCIATVWQACCCIIMVLIWMQGFSVADFLQSIQKQSDAEGNGGQKKDTSS